MSDYLTHDHPAPTDEKPLQHLSIQVRHSEGGYSFYDGKGRKRGLVVGFQMVDIEVLPSGWTSRSFMLLGGSEHAMSFHVSTLARRNPKTAAKLVDFVNANLDRLIHFGMLKDWPMVDAVLTEFSAHDRAKIAA